MCGHTQVFVSLNDSRKPMEQVVCRGTQNKNRAELLLSKAMTFCWRKYLMEAIWVGYTIIFPGGKMLPREKLNPIYSALNATIF